jgi:vacuolar-type H+-ATPase subunit E/Vma4
VLVLSLRAKGGLENLFLEENKMRVSELIKALKKINDPEVTVYNGEEDKESRVVDLEFGDGVLTLYTEN